MTKAPQQKGSQWRPVRTIMMVWPWLLVPGRLVQLLEQGALETIVPSSALQSHIGSQDSLRSKSGSALRGADKKRFLLPFLASFVSAKSWSACRPDSLLIIFKATVVAVYPVQDDATPASPVASRVCIRTVSVPEVGTLLPPTGGCHHTPLVFSKGGKPIGKITTWATS
ncbi:hypothetical protein LX32DRAFT_121282 [Colletotrichum zoysiae]|uniref:Uncharacterized protein n=1 Tax=Colletotrichum zoysiae TaxID=1216348 RepID=A0AAD9LZR2_9PEZI|nr:hypothetical protein LX32DRAFT_121282 [Colletotrichum zoysiae]